MQPVGYIDGQIGPIDTIRVPVLDRGFLYGDSIYEVFRTYNGIPFLFDAHYERLLNSAKLSGMVVSQTKAGLVDALKRTVASAENPDRQDVYVRYQITRGEGPVDLYPAPDLTSRLVVIVKPVPSWNPQHYSVGMTLSVPQQRRNPISSLDPNIKGGNYLNNILALSESRDQGADDCLMLNARGMVTECSNSNVWFVIDGQYVTPEAGNLVGLTRRTLLDLIRQDGQEAVERGMFSEELVNVEECFVTSATREVMPVKSLTLENGETLEFADGGGDKTRRAMRLYSEMMATFVDSHGDEAWF